MTTQIVEMTANTLVIKTQSRQGVVSGQRTFATPKTWVAINNVLAYVHSPSDCKAIASFYKTHFTPEQLAKLRQGYFPSAADTKAQKKRTAAVKVKMAKNEKTIDELARQMSNHAGFMGGDARVDDLVEAQVRELF